MNEKHVKLDKIVDRREKVLIGRDNGMNGLEKLKKAGVDFQALEAKCDRIIIDVPDTVVSINGSYFLGMFETSVERLGKEGFKSKYAFNASDHIKNKISNHIDAASLNASQEDILNG